MRSCARQAFGERNHPHVHCKDEQDGWSQSCMFIRHWSVFESRNPFLSRALANLPSRVWKQTRNFRASIEEPYSTCQLRLLQPVASQSQCDAGVSENRHSEMYPTNTNTSHGVWGFCAQNSQVQPPVKIEVAFCKFKNSYWLFL
jgi:hypothetical protein